MKINQLKIPLIIIQLVNNNDIHRQKKSQLTSSIHLMHSRMCWRRWQARQLCASDLSDSCECHNRDEWWPCYQYQHQLQRQSCHWTTTKEWFHDTLVIIPAHGCPTFSLSCMHHDTQCGHCKYMSQILNIKANQNFLLVWIKPILLTHRH